MARTNHSHTCRKDLQRSRRGGLRNRKGHLKTAAWRISLRRGRHAIDSALLLIAGGHARLEAIQTCPVGPRLVREARRLLGMPRLLGLIQYKLARAAFRLREAAGSVALDPGGADAPSRIVRETERLIEASVRLAVLCAESSEVLPRMRRVFEAAVAEAEARHAEGADHEAPAGEPPAVAVPKHTWRRIFLRRLRWRPSDRLRSLRRRRRSPMRAADAPRRISRGRAPPPMPVCQL